MAEYEKKVRKIMLQNGCNFVSILYLLNNLHPFFNQFIIFTLHSTTPLLSAILIPYALMLSQHKQ